MLYIIERSVEQGRRAGLASVRGIHAATPVPCAAALGGLSAILASSATAFSAVKYSGAAHLVWLGVKKFLGPDEAAEAAAEARGVAHARLFRGGFVVNLLEPEDGDLLSRIPSAVRGRGHEVNRLDALGVRTIRFNLMGER